MPTPIIANVASATSGNKARNLKGQQKAKDRGAVGVRYSVGIDSDGSNLVTIDTQHVYDCTKQAAQHNFDFVELLFGYGPKVTQPLADAYNGGVLWPERNRPPAGAGNGLWNWIGDVAWTQKWQAARQGAIDGSKDPATFLRPAWCSESCYGGVGGPHKGNLSEANAYAQEWETYRISDPARAQAALDKAYSVAYQAFIIANPGAWKGKVEAGFFAYLKHVVTRVNWQGSDCIIGTLEGSGSTEAQREVDSWAGADVAAIVALPEARFINSNRYADECAVPYIAANERTKYGTKLQAQRTRVLANPNFAGKLFAISEGGIFKNRCPRCMAANQVRNDLIVGVKAEIGIAYFGYYIMLAPLSSDAGNTTYAYYEDPANGAVVALEGAELVL